MTPRTIVVIATYNEAATIQGILEALTDYHVIVVDDNSPDGTGDLARAYAHVTVIDRPAKLGIASAYITGIKAALEMGAYFVVQMDAGLTHPLWAVKPMLIILRDWKAGVVIGSRFLRRHEWHGRTLVSRGAALAMRLLGVRVKDATSGFRVWRAYWLKQIDLDRVHAEGFAFQLEMLWLAHRAGAEIWETPIPYRLTNSSFRPWMLWEGLRTWFRLALSR